MLNINDLTKNFGGVVAVDNVSLEVRKGTILGLIGPNGAGKTTLINLITGMEKADAGQVFFKHKKVTNMKPHEIARLGMGRTFQISRVFRGMSVLENLCVPRLWRYENLDSIEKKADEVLKFFDLAHLKDELAGNLSGGQQKLCEMARISMMDPDLYLLDEPFVGVHIVIKTKILDSIVSLNKMGKTFVIISHDIPDIMNTCDRVVVLSSGTLIADGDPEEVRHNQTVIEAYLGV
jgi:branched-chain amino acid transport system ATP-binding protein